jgi:hypothetical protein
LDEETREVARHGVSFGSRAATPYRNKHDFEEAAHCQIDEIEGLRRLAPGERADPEAVAIGHAELWKALIDIGQLKSHLYPSVKALT